MVRALPLSLPPSFYLPRKEQPGRQPAPLAQTELPERREVLTRRQAHRGTLCLRLALIRSASLPLDVPSSQWKTVEDCSCCRHLKKKSLYSSWVSILEAVLPTDHQLTSFLFFFYSCFFIPALIFLLLLFFLLFLVFCLFVFFIKLHTRGFLDPPLLLSCPTKLKHCVCLYLLPLSNLEVLSVITT